MIESLARLAFMYLITRTFIELAFPAGRYFLKYIYWSTVALMVFVAISPFLPIVSRFFDDVHSAVATYGEGKKAVNNFLGNDKELPSVGYLDPLERIMGAKWEVPVKGKIIQTFKGEDHHGIDIGCNVNTPIKTTRPGTVSKVFLDPTYGLTIIVNHGNGYESLYAHCNKVLVTERDKLLKGDKIAVSGGKKGDKNAGNSEGPHLHFEIRINNVAKDPVPYFN